MPIELTEADLAQHAALRTLAKQAENVERVVIALENQIRRFTADGWPEIAFAWSDEQVPALRKIRSELMAQLPAMMEGTALYDWVERTPGLGKAVFFVLGLMPPIAEFRSVGGVWKYTGLAPVDGHAVRRRAGERLGFNARLRSYVLVRLAERCVKHRASPYRGSYDQRKLATLAAHPDMVGEGGGCETCDRAYRRTKELRAQRQFERERKAVAVDCANLGGIHWAPKHRHADALRVVGKAILRDAWRIAHGQDAIAGTGGGDHTRTDTHKARELALVPA